MMTYSLLTDDNFEEESTLLVLDSPANPTLLRENVWRLVTSVTSGERSSEYWAKQRHHGLWERTSQDSLALNLEPSSEGSSVTWPRWGTSWDGVAMEHPTSVRSTEENGSSLLLGTPTARDHKGKGRAGQLPTQLLPTARASAFMARKLKVSPGGARGRLEGVIAEEYLPTPRASKLGGTSGEGFSPTLHEAVMLPTPAANPTGKVRMEDIVDKDGNPPTHSGQRWYDKHTGRLVQKGLKEAVMLATPAAADAQGSHGGGQGRSLRTDIHTYKAETGESGMLNPSFVAAMMGFPDSWFEIE